MRITTTKHGLRLTQHGAVLSELRTSPGPTHSVFDVLAALIAALSPTGRIGVLGFAGGGMMAPLRALGVESVVDSVDLDRTGYELFCQHCPDWAQGVKWEQADAVTWLSQQRPEFALLLDDLSVPCDGDVFKPEVSWTVLPELIRQRLRPGGFAVFNLMLSPGDRWRARLEQLPSGFSAARVVELDEFENRIVVAGEALPTARELGRSLREALLRIRSRQAKRLGVRTW